MSTQDLNMERPTPVRRDEAGRIIELEVQFPNLREIKMPEVKMPDLKEVKAPEVNLEPVRRAAEKVLLIGIGAAVLVGRGVVSLVESAARAGEEAAEHPGPVTRRILGVVRPESAPAAPEVQPRVRVPMVPIAGYDVLSTEEIEARLDALSQEQLRSLRDYEARTKNREAVLGAIDRRMSA